MEPDVSSSGPVKPPPLNSDQLNYLIWRYLQESGYGDAAVKLQRDWKVEAESLPFAKHIKGQALISLVQKGLRYHHLALTIDDRGRPSRRLEPSMFFFGPEGVRPDTSTQEPLIRDIDTQRQPSPLNTSSTVPRKRESEYNGLLDPSTQPQKRGRKSTQTAERNGTTRKSSAAPPSMDMNAMDIDSVNGTSALQSTRSPSAGEPLHDDHATNGASIDTRMEIDTDVRTPTSPEPVHEHVSNDVPTLIHTLTNGESVGVQVAPAKVVNLGPSASVLAVADDLHVIKTAWRPGDQALLAASGHNFCGCWKLAGSGFSENGAKIPYEELLNSEHAKLITAFSWASNGSALAIATYAEQGGQIDVYDGHDLTLVETLPGSQREITSLRWLADARSLVGIVPGEEGDTSERSTASILTWNVSTSQDGPKSPEIQHAPNLDMFLDMDTAEGQGHGVVWVAGRHNVYRYAYGSQEPDSDTQAKRELVTYEPPSNVRDGWSFIRCRTQQLGDEAVVVASAESACIWLPHKNAIFPDTHSAAITGLELRARVFQLPAGGAYPDFATASVDGSVKVWTYDAYSNSIQTLHKITIDQSSPIMALTFSPDGFCLAGASYGQVHIWNAEHGYNLMASWQGVNTEWRGSSLKEEDIMSNGGVSSVNGDVGSTASEHNLSWATDSKKLAFGLGSQVAILNFQR